MTHEPKGTFLFVEDQGHFYPPLTRTSVGGIHLTGANVALQDDLPPVLARITPDLLGHSTHGSALTLTASTTSSGFAGRTDSSAPPVAIAEDGGSGTAVSSATPVATVARSPQEPSSTELGRPSRYGLLPAGSL